MAKLSGFLIQCLLLLLGIILQIEARRSSPLLVEEDPRRSNRPAGMFKHVFFGDSHIIIIRY